MEFFHMKLKLILSIHYYGIDEIIIPECPEDNPLW